MFAVGCCLFDAFGFVLVCVGMLVLFACFLTLLALFAVSLICDLYFLTF